MTRDEEIHKTANTISTNIGKDIDEDYICNDEYDFTIGFECGAKWSDEHPKEGLVSIDKVCEYLKSLVYQDFAGGPLERTFSDEDIEEFKKAMEE